MTSSKPPPLPYDSGYKLLFSHPRLVADLLTGFVKPAWLHLIDLGTLEPHKASYITDDLRQRHDDSIWRIKTHTDGTWLYLYILIEFQSRNEHFMAIRILSYEALLYQDIIRAQNLRQSDKLPPIIPIVIYNGSGLLEVSVPSDVRAQQPENLVGHLIAIGQYQNLQEVHTMLAEKIDQWVQDAENRGETRGEATLLQRLLTRKFGILPATLQQRVQTATSAQLETWSLNILDATTLDDVFKN